MTSVLKITPSLNALRAMLVRYLPDPDDLPAVEAVVDVYAALTAYQINIAGEASKELGDVAMRAMLGMTLGWQANPFIHRHGAQFIHTVGLSVGAVIDGMQYREEAARLRDRRDEDKAREMSMRATACMNETINVAIAAIVLQKGVGYARAKSFQIREDMWDLPKE